MSTPTPKELFTNSISELTELVKKHDSLASKIGEYRIQAKNETLADVLPEEIVEFSLPEPTPFTTWDEFMADVDAYVTYTNEAFDQLVDEATAKLQGSTKTERQTLAETIDTKTELVKALVTVLASMGEDVSDVEIPTITRKRASSKNTGPSVNKKNQTFYRKMTDGTISYQSSFQNSISSMAYYHSHEMTTDSKRMSTPEFKQALLNSGITNLVSKPWKFKLPSGIILGMDIVKG